MAAEVETLKVGTFVSAAQAVGESSQSKRRTLQASFQAGTWSAWRDSPLGSFEEVDRSDQYPPC